ncbi:MAG TPA: hypothetical protein VGC63_08390 [Solirubrobacterales bacterium]|jgi:hypothetical protein
MRALVIFDTHFGAWTGRDLLREGFFLERLAPRLEGIDGLIFLGDLFDFLFGSVAAAVDASARLLGLIAEKMEGKTRLPCRQPRSPSGYRDAEKRLEAQLAAGRSPLVTGEPIDPAAHGLATSSPGAFPECRSRSHTRPTASPACSALTATVWTGTLASPVARRSSACPHPLGDRHRLPGAAEDDRGLRVNDQAAHRAAHIAAQMSHGTHAQQNVCRAGRPVSTLGLPLRGAKRLAAELREHGLSPADDTLPSAEHFDSVVRNEAERQRCEQPRQRQHVRVLSAALVDLAQ